jgi:hypothetical protein
MSKDIAGKRSHPGEVSVTSEAAACYRLYAANCIELAENVPDVDRRVFLLNMARDWLRLADQAERHFGNAPEDASQPANPHPEPPPEP